MDISWVMKFLSWQNVGSNGQLLNEWNHLPVSFYGVLCGPRWLISPWNIWKHWRSGAFLWHFEETKNKVFWGRYLCRRNSLYLFWRNGSLAEWLGSFLASECLKFRTFLFFFFCYSSTIILSVSLLTKEKMGKDERK